METGSMRGIPMPHNNEAEQSVLGSMLQAPQAVMVAAEALEKEDFFSPAHQEIFDAMKTVAQKGTPVDLVTTDAELSRKGMLDGIGGTVYLVTLMQSVPTTVNVKAYVELVLEKSTLRKLIKACETISQECYTQQSTLEETLSLAEKAIFDIVMKRSGGDQLVHIKQVLQSTYEKIEELARLRGKIAGVPTGFVDLDKLLTGLHGGELVLLGARPSMGKTSIAMNICQTAAVRNDKCTAIFSLEMPREQIAMRMLCSESRVDMQRVRSGSLSDDDWMKIAGQLNTMGNAPMYIDDTAGVTPSQVRSRARRLMMDHGLDLIMIDYMQLMSSDKKTENRQLEVSEISRQLKAIALELKVPLIACAQLSRAATARQDKRPVLSDLRDSGSIEQDADVVMFLHRESYYDPSSEEKNIAEVIIAKQRNGPLGTVKLGWMSEYTTFGDLPENSPHRNYES